MHKNEYLPLKFSRDKYFTNISLDEFKSAAGKLEDIIKSSRGSAHSVVSVCENINDYLNSGVIPAESCSWQQTNYSLDKVDQNLWDKSYSLGIKITLPGKENSFAVYLGYDKGEKKRLFFYGQSLDQKTYDAIKNEFGKIGLFYKVGDGQAKHSDFRDDLIWLKLKDSRKR